MPDVYLSNKDLVASIKDTDTVVLVMSNNSIRRIQKGKIIPTPTTSDNGKIAYIQNGAWVKFDLDSLGYAVAIDITYSTAHGTAPVAKQVVVKRSTGYTLTAADLPTLSATGWTFNGWNHRVGDVIREDTQLVASWTQIEYTSITLSYQTAHGVAPANKVRQYPTGSYYTLTNADVEPISASGWRFTGWSKSAGAHVTEDTVLVASWEEIVYTNITLSYVSAHGTPPDAKVKTIEQGKSYTLTNDDLPDLSAEGWIWGGWNKSAGQTVSSNTTITASWTEDTTPRVYYGKLATDSIPGSVSGLTEESYTGSAIAFNTNTGANEYTFFIAPVSAGTVSLEYQVNGQGSWLSGGFTSLGTATYNGVSCNVYRTSNEDLGSVSFKATIN